MKFKTVCLALCTSLIFTGSLVGQGKDVNKSGTANRQEDARLLSKAKEARRSALEAYQITREGFEEGSGVNIQQLAQASEQYFFFDAQVVDAYNNLLNAAGVESAAKGEFDAFEKLGVTFREIQESYVRWQLGLNNEMGLFLHKVHEGGLAAKAQLQDGDLIYQVGFGGERINIKNAKELLEVADRSRNNDLTVFFKRDAVKMKTKIRLEKFDRADYRVGVYVDEMTEILQKQLQVNGVVVTSTTEDGPAKAAGLQADDIVIAIDGVAVESKKQLSQLIDSSGGKELEFKILSGGNRKSVQITPVLVPEKKSHAVIESTWPIQHTFEFDNPLLVQREGVWQISRQGVDGISSDAKISTLIENVEQLTQQIKKLELEVTKIKSHK